MAETVVCTHPFGADIPRMVAKSRSLDSRALWPGATPEWSSADRLLYQLSIRLKAAAMTDVAVEEKLGPVEQGGDGSAQFAVEQVLTWPDGVARANIRYRFVPGTPNTLEFVYTYDPPTTKLVKTKDLPGFHSAMEKVAARYVDRLTRDEA